jgi:hypothetical protein
MRGERGYARVDQAARSYERRVIYLTRSRSPKSPARRLLEGALGICIAVLVGVNVYLLAGAVVTWPAYLALVVSASAVGVLAGVLAEWTKGGSGR